jgi:hypothetical protein
MKKGFGYIMFRRFLAINRHKNLLSSNQLEILVHANEFYSNGKAGEAGPLFEKLAGQLETGNHPRRAANLYAQAAHAFADNQDETRTLVCARKALTLFTKYRMTQRTPVFFANITQKYEALGMGVALTALQAEYGSTSPVELPKPGEGLERNAGHLPPICRGCGAPVRSNEVYWIDNSSAECIYCGSVLLVAAV